MQRFKCLLAARRSFHCNTHFRTFSALPNYATVNKVEDDVLVEGKAYSRSSILNRPDSLNALTTPMAGRLNRLYESWEKNPDIGFVLMKNNGRVFSSGSDVVTLYNNLSHDYTMALRTVARNFRSKLLPRFTPAFMLHSHATSFGYKEVPEEEKSKMVGNVFTNVASNYDLMNDLMSAGLHRLWKERLVSKLNPFPGMKHLDVAGGTGDVAFRILESVNSVRHKALRDMLEDNLQEETQIYVCDINPNMLNVGKMRAQERGLGEDGSLVWVEGDAEALNFEDDSIDGYTIAFGIRNVTHIEKVLSEAYRVLKKGGRFLCLELSHVENPAFKQFYDYHSFSVIPAIGELVVGDRNSYQYLVESIRKFPSQAVHAYGQGHDCDYDLDHDFRCEYDHDGDFNYLFL